MKLFSTEVRPFMTALLTSDTFDAFHFVSGELVTVCRMEFTESAADWGIFRERFSGLIKGGKTPKTMKLAFSLAPDKLPIPAEIQVPVSSFSLNVFFENGELRLTTGVNLKEFTPDRSADAFWDKYIAAFIEARGIKVTEIG